jgi:hypothetical protein
VVSVLLPVAAAFLFAGGMVLLLHAVGRVWRGGKGNVRRAVSQLAGPLAGHRASEATHIAGPRRGLEIIGHERLDAVRRLGRRPHDCVRGVARSVAERSGSACLPWYCPVAAARLQSKRMLETSSPRQTRVGGRADEPRRVQRTRAHARRPYIFQQVIEVFTWGCVFFCPDE